MNFTEAQTNRSLQELLTTTGTFIQLGKLREIKLESGLTIKVIPEFYFVNCEMEVFDSHLEFFCQVSKDGFISFKTPHNQNKEMESFVKEKDIDAIQVNANLILLWKKGKATKLSYYAMKSRFFRDVDTHDDVEYFSQVVPSNIM